MTVRVHLPRSSITVVAVRTPADYHVNNNNRFRDPAQATPFAGGVACQTAAPVHSRLMKLNKGDVCFLPRLWNTILSGNRIQALVNKQYYCFLEVRSDVAVAVL